MAAYQDPYYQDRQYNQSYNQAYNQAYAATDPPYYDNTAFQEGVGDASFYDYNVNVGPYDVQGQWDVAAPPPSMADVKAGQWGQYGAGKQFGHRSSSVEWTTIGLMLFLAIILIAAAALFMVSASSNGGSTTETDEGNLTATTELELKVPTMIRQMLTTPP